MDKSHECYRADSVLSTLLACPADTYERDLTNTAVGQVLCRAAPCSMNSSTFLGEAGGDVSTIVDLLAQYAALSLTFDLVTRTQSHKINSQASV